MIYKIILGKNEINIDEEDKNKIIQNIDKNFIILKSGELVNPSFVQGVFIDHEATRQNRKSMEMIRNSDRLLLEEKQRESGDVTTLLKKYKPEFLQDKN